MIKRIDSTNCTHDLALNRIAELEAKIAEQLKINEQHARNILSQGDEIERLESRLDSAAEVMRGVGLSATSDATWEAWDLVWSYVVRDVENQRTESEITVAVGRRTAPSE